jgi:aminoglycoside/choline kinase family phosphotransferase
MDVLNSIAQGYRYFFGNDEIGISALPKSGSDRKYFRITAKDRTIIGAYNPVKEENDAFTGFTAHFRSKGLKVPEIYGYLPEQHVYFIQDLGDVNMYSWLAANRRTEAFDDKTNTLYHKTLKDLLLFQTEGVKDMDLNLCYPHKSFDLQSMIWDMNYFKYMFLKLLAVPFNELYLEHDFHTLAGYLLEAGQDYFLYRDFQTANVMIVDDEPWFIDYQGGRKGAPQYDVASLLYDAKIPLHKRDRLELLDFYADSFSLSTGSGREQFMDFFEGFALIRIMQALGAFGFRGLYEKKPTFTESIVPGVALLNEIVTGAEKIIRLPELYCAIRSVPETTLFRELVTKHNSGL